MSIPSASAASRANWPLPTAAIDMLWQMHVAAELGSGGLLLKVLPDQVWLFCPVIPQGNRDNGTKLTTG